MRLAACLLSASLLLPAAVSADSFELGTLVVEPGRRASGALVVPAGSDAGVDIPVTVVHGAGDGPVLALIAGTHGYEYPPILALQRVAGRLDPSRLGGTVILVHAANPAAFFGRSIYLNPVDGLNLNRVYPGDPAGTQSERIAHVLTTRVIERADYVIDLHAGDGNESLRPYTYMPVTGDPGIDAGTRRLALAFGIDHVVVDRTALRDPAESDFTDYTALSRGIPAITTETGGLGSAADAWVALAESGIDGVLRELGMLPGGPPAPGPVVWLHDYTVVPSPATGVFTPRIGRGDVVAEGAVLGSVSDLHGRDIATVRAPFAGLVNYVVATPPIREGEPAVMLSRIGPDPAE